MEVDLTGVDPLTHPVLATWEWHIAAYLFIGGLVAGVMIIGAVIRLRRATGFERGIRVAEVVSLPLIVGGLLLLFADLGNGWNSWRFYTSFEPTSAMSWGSWILAIATLALVARLALHAGSVAEGPGRIRAALGAAGRWGRRLDGRWLDWTLVVLGVGLGTYTGVLLSTIPARPLWDSLMLPLLFLVSGVAVGGALICLFLDRDAHLRLFPLLATLCAVEVTLIGAYFMTLRLGSAATREAAGLLFEGWFGLALWGGTVVLGLVVPVAIELAERARRTLPHLMSRAAPSLKLAGGALLRFVIVYAGLESAI